MNRDTKHWKFIEITSGSGKKYHNKRRDVIMILYWNKIRLFKDHIPLTNKYPCFYKKCLVKKLR